MNKTELSWLIVNSQPSGPLVLKGGYNAHTRKQVKRVIFVQQSVYTHILKRVLKTANFRGKGMFLKLNFKIVIHD